MPNTYIPDKGDLVWINFQPTMGHEQSGRRPALILSPKAYNSVTGLAIACPITSRAKGYPFEVALPESSHVIGVVLADHIRNLDWRGRQCELIERVTDSTLRDTLTKFATLIGS